MVDQHGDPARKILFITLDQFRADLIHGRLAEHSSLPNLKAFAKEATSFNQTFSVTTPCGPSRTSLLTGMYAMNHRSICSGIPLANHHTNLALEVRKHGVEPLLFGYTDTTQDPRGRPSSDPDLKSYEQVMPGFREIVSMPFLSSLSWMSDLSAKGYDVPNLRAPWYPECATGPESILEPAMVRSEDSDTAFLANETIKNLDRRRDDSWLAHVTFIRPHPPFHVPEPWNKLHDPDAIPDAIAVEDFERERNIHPVVGTMFSEPMLSYMYKGFDGWLSDIDESTRRACRAVYLGLAAEVDHHLGRIFDWLKAAGLWEQTLIIITSDHGEMLGDHFMWGKEAVYDSCYHVPLLIRDPERPGKAGYTIESFVESVDIAPTILEWIGASAPTEFDGYSLLPYLNGGIPTGERDHVFMELELSHPESPSTIETKLGLGLREANVAMIRDNYWKYVHFNGGLPPLLFDLKNDPNETVNLAEMPAFQAELRRLSAKMLDHRMTSCFNAVTKSAITANGPMTRSV